MNRVFITADTHFGHKKVIEFEPARSHYKTIAEHDEDLIALATGWVRDRLMVHCLDSPERGDELPDLNDVGGLS